MIARFIKGFFGRHVDWQTRHNSRAYDFGRTAKMLAIFGAPFIFVFVGGFIAGRYWP